MEPQKRINKPKKLWKEAKLTPVHRELNTRPFDECWHIMGHKSKALAS
jgi:hypothetical protein